MTLTIAQTNDTIITLPTWLIEALGLHVGSVVDAQVQQGTLYLQPTHTQPNGIPKTEIFLPILPPQSIISKIELPTKTVDEVLSELETASFSEPALSVEAWEREWWPIYREMKELPYCPVTTKTGNTTTPVTASV